MIGGTCEFGFGCTACGGDDDELDRDLGFVRADDDDLGRELEDGDLDLGLGATPANGDLDLGLEASENCVGISS